MKPWNGVEPIREDYMKNKNHWGNSNPEIEPDICSVLRAIYHRSNNEDIKIRCRVAMAMATKMRISIMRLKDAL